jgi:hypothetical protein
MHVLAQTRPAMPPAFAVMRPSVCQPSSLGNKHDAIWSPSCASHARSPSQSVTHPREPTHLGQLGWVAGDAGV